MKKILKILLPVGILAFAIGITVLMLVFRKEAPRRNFQAPPREVVVRSLVKADYQIVLESQGTVQARTTSSFISEVRGRIISVGPNFREGSFFEAGELLLEIDPSDYQTELIVAQAAAAQAELDLAQEQARSDQAKRDWERLNPGVAANHLTLREPQLKQAAAALASAQARIKTAQANLARTSIRAPFAGRMLSKNVDVGQYVSPGVELARGYAVDFAEVRLPLTATQFSYLEMPSIYRGENPTIEEGPAVTLQLEVAGSSHQWQGRIVRAEGAVDTRSRQLFVVAQIDNPYGRTASGRPPLKVGSFVKASLTGKVIKGVFIIPRNLLRENSYVLTVARDESGDVIRRRKVGIVWQNDKVVVVNQGLATGDLLCLTQIPIALENYPVRSVQETAIEETSEAKAEEPTRRGPSRSNNAGEGFAKLLAAIPADKPLPAALKAKLETAMAAAEKGDRSQMRPVMGELRKWAQDNGVELPAFGRR